MNEQRHTPCATCGACCRSYIVPVCGHDVWLMSTRQRLGPEQFLVACPQPEPGPDGFLLALSGPTYGLALDKQGRFTAERPCLFLLELAGGNTRCGVYAHRPVVCQGYPMTVRSGLVLQREDALCPPNSWPEAEVRRPAWRAAIQRLRMHFDVYYQVVARWNARVLAAGPGVRFALPEYFSYLLNVYHRLAGLAEDLGAETIARVQADWPEPGQDAASPVWLDYVGQARQVIESFYPEVRPLPEPISMSTVG